jgi:hypothetical protein
VSLDELPYVEDDVCGLAVRLHHLGWFRVQMVAVMERGDSVTIERRNGVVGHHGAVALRSESRFACHRRLLSRIDTQLARLGVVGDMAFAARNIADGTHLTGWYRAPSGELHRLDLFCWDYCEDGAVRRVGDFLQQLAATSQLTWRWRALLSWVW